MNLEAIWSLTFQNISSNQSDLATQTYRSGNGIVIFESGRVFGGDSGFVYIGKYEYDVKKDSIKMEVEVKKYGMSPLDNIFPGRNQLILILEGERSFNKISIKGYIKGEKKEEIHIEANWIEDLP